MRVIATNNVCIEGSCNNFPSDTYTIEIQETNMYIGVYDGNSEEMNSVIVSQEDAIKIAEQILNFYKGGSK